MGSEALMPANLRPLPLASRRALEGPLAGRSRCSTSRTPSRGTQLLRLSCPTRRIVLTLSHSSLSGLSLHSVRAASLCIVFARLRSHFYRATSQYIFCGFDHTTSCCPKALQLWTDSCVCVSLSCPPVLYKVFSTQTRG